ncbi:hypothetical protein E2R60_04960 [Paenibacillus dendritiformis]|nr:hypothetical protein E2R60_04960 [Paenibacillus dendritiformis]
MTIEIKQRLLPDGRPNKPSRSMKPQYITIHNTDNAKPDATAEAHASYVINGSGGRQASWHFTVDDKEIYQHLRENEQGWHAGDGSGPGNASSIGVEVCMYLKMKTEQCWQNAAWLVARLLDKHKLGIDRVVPHQKWSGKRCPSQLLPYWSKFIQMCKDELKKLQQPKPPASGGTNILGKASATVEQAREWARSKKAPAEFVELASLYWELAPARGGVDPAVAYVQFGHETGYLYRDGKSAAGIDASYRNPCGLKITAGGGDTQASAHMKFANWREGITAHLDHLALYAGASGYPKKDTPDPRHFAYLLGTARTVESLGTKWAPSPSYGTRLADELAKMRGMKAEAPPSFTDTATIEVNGKKIAEGPLVNGAVFAPVRVVGEALGCRVGWNQQTKTASINGVPVPGELIGNSAYAHVRAVADAAGARIKWDGKECKVSITTS